MQPSLLRIHATCVAIGKQGVLLLGEPGAGKSDLALRLIDRGALLVADDQVELRRKRRAIVANVPTAIRGLLEIRGLGIYRLRIRRNVPVMLVVQLVRSSEWVERLPYPEPYDCLGASIPQLCLSGFETSAAIKVEMAIAALQDGSMTVGALKE